MTISSIIPNPGDVVVLRFNFLDGTGSKTRPAIAVSSHIFNSSRGYFIFVPLTGSPGHWDDVIEIYDLEPARLNRRSYSHGMLFTANNEDIRRVQGTLSAPDFARLRAQFKSVMQL